MKILTTGYNYNKQIDRRGGITYAIVPCRIDFAVTNLPNNTSMLLKSNEILNNVQCYKVAIKNTVLAGQLTIDKVDIDSFNNSTIKTIDINIDNSKFTTAYFGTITTSAKLIETEIQCMNVGELKTIGNNEVCLTNVSGQDIISGKLDILFYIYK